MALHCRLLIPDLLWREGMDTCRGLPLPALTALLARGTALSSVGITPEAWLCQSFGVARQSDWPVAPLTLTLDGGTAGSHYWLRADPVHLHLLRDRMVLADSGTFPVSQQEAVQFTETLNRHFQKDGMIFYPLHPARWYLRLDAPPQIATAGLSEVAGRNIRSFLPHGEQAVRWHGLFNEIQMLLHHHPANEAREARGELPVNSVWLWGGGTAPQVTKRPYSHVWANDALAQALARTSGAACAALLQQATEWLAAARDGDHLIVLDSLRGAAQYRDTQGYGESLAELERAWFAPLKAALRNGRIASLALVALDESGVHTFTVRRGNLWKLWRRNPLLKAAHA